MALARDGCWIFRHTSMTMRFLNRENSPREANVNVILRQAGVSLLAGALAFATFDCALALDKIRVAKGGIALMFAVVEVGQMAKIWEKNGLEVQSIQTDGEAPMDKAMVAGDVDIGLGAGTSMAFRLKGVPNIAVATLSGPPADFVLVVNPDGPIKKVEDLKGKSVGVTSAGSLTYYFVKALSEQMGWGPDGIVAQPLGNSRANFAALARGDTAAMVSTPETAYGYAERGKAAVLMSFGDKIKTFLTHTILASNEMVEKKPEQLKRFLKGWFETVKYMKNPANREASVKSIAHTLSITEDAAGKAFDIDVKALSDDGAFDAKAVDVIRNTLPSFGVLDAVPAAKDLYTDKFVPVKVD
jgi:ABC-type nitrate/sulfonate/bicarbonate transport system substrate-binding protein